MSVNALATLLEAFLSRHQSAETWCWDIVLRHSAGGVHLLYVVCIIRNAHALLMEAEHSITFTTYSSVNVFIALGWSSENDYGFYLSIYLAGLWIDNQDYEYYTCSVHLLYIQLVTKLYAYGFSCSRLHIQLYSVLLSTSVFKLLGQCELINCTWTLHGGSVRRDDCFPGSLILCNDPIEGFL